MDFEQKRQNFFSSQGPVLQLFHSIRRFVFGMKKGILETHGVDDVDKISDRRVDSSHEVIVFKPW